MDVNNKNNKKTPTRNLQELCLTPTTKRRIQHRNHHKIFANEEDSNTVSITKELSAATTQKQSKTVAT
jgi:hypothetical protein